MLITPTHRKPWSVAVNFSFRKLYIAMKKHVSASSVVSPETERKFMKAEEVQSSDKDYFHISGLRTYLRRVAWAKVFLLLHLLL